VAPVPASAQSLSDNRIHTPQYIPIHTVRAPQPQPQKTAKMTLKDLLKKKEKTKDEGGPPLPPKGPTLSPDVPEFTFMRTTTSTQEVIAPPSFPGDPTREQPMLSPDPHKKFGRFRRHSNAGHTEPIAEDSKGENRLSRGLHFGRQRSSSSVNIPEDLPDISVTVARNEDDEARWEKRATILAKGNILNQSGSTTPNFEQGNPMNGTRPGTGTRSRSVSVSKDGDVGGAPLTTSGELKMLIWR
jgi:hypothetical protein